MTKPETNKEEVDRWIDVLGGRAGEDDDTQAARIRQIVLQQQQGFEEELDDLRLRRGKKQLMANIAPSRPASPFGNHRWLGLAASVAVIVMASSVFLLKDSTDPVDDGTPKSLGAPGTVTDAPIQITLEAVDGVAALDQIQAALLDAGLSFETREDDQDGVVLVVTAATPEEVDTLSSALGDFDRAPLLVPGTYHIHVR